MSPLSIAPTVVPKVIAHSRPLAEAYRLDLARFVAVEEESVRIGEALARHAPDRDALNLAGRQTLEDACHLEVFGRRLDETLQASQPDHRQAAEVLLLRMLQGEKAPDAVRLRRNVTRAVVAGPLRRHLDRCRAAAESGAFLDALALFDLVLKSMAAALYDYQGCCWQPFDAHFAWVIRTVAEHERRHVAFAAYVVGGLVAEADSGERLRQVCDEGHALLQEGFRASIRQFVGRFAAVAEQHPEWLADVEFAPGRPFLETPAEEQVALIETACEAAYAGTLARARLNQHGYQESLSCV